jgi:CheY-like chemotaxis protein
MNDKSVLIYLADDDEDDRLIFSEALSELSTYTHTLITAEDGNKLLDHLTVNTTRPDIVFLDLNMPNKNGKETLMQIRRNSAFMHLPIVVYSTSTSDLDIDEAYEKGASLYVEKPYSIAHLVKVLQLVINIDWKANRGKVARNNFFIPSRDC